MLRAEISQLNKETRNSPRVGNEGTKQNKKDISIEIMKHESMNK